MAPIWSDLAIKVTACANAIFQLLRKTTNRCFVEADLQFPITFSLRSKLFNKKSTITIRYSDI